MMRKVLSVFAIVGLMSLLSVQAAVEPAKLVKDGKVDKKAVEQAMAEGADISSITKALVTEFPEMASDLNQQLGDQFPEQAEAIEMTAKITVLEVASQDLEEQVEEGATEIEDDTEQDEKGKVLGRAAAAGNNEAQKQVVKILAKTKVSKSQDKQRVIKDVFRTLAKDADALAEAIVVVAQNDSYDPADADNEFVKAIKEGTEEAVKSGETTLDKLTEASQKAVEEADDDADLGNLTGAVDETVEKNSAGYSHE
jgi:hypothetical protein